MFKNFKVKFLTVYTKDIFNKFIHSYKVPGLATIIFDKIELTKCPFPDGKSQHVVSTRDCLPDNLSDLHWGFKGLNYLEMSTQSGLKILCVHTCTRHI